MKNTNRHADLLKRLKSGMHFGLFEDDRKCYFQDGFKVSYTELWAGLKEFYQLPEKGYPKTLAELCPDTFVGVHSYKYAKHKWKAKMSIIIRLKQRLRALIS